MKLKRTFLTGSWTNLGLLILRLGIGIMYMTHGWPKISAGPEMWEKLGGQMSLVGVSFGLVFWGFMAAFAEFFGGLLLALGFLTRPAAFLMFFTMLIAGLTHFSHGDGLSVASHAIELGIVFLALLFIGGGRYSLDSLLFDRKK